MTTLTAIPVATTDDSDNAPDAAIPVSGAASPSAVGSAIPVAGLGTPTSVDSAIPVAGMGTPASVSAIPVAAPSTSVGAIAEAIPVGSAGLGIRRIIVTDAGTEEANGTYFFDGVKYAKNGLIEISYIEQEDVWVLYNDGDPLYVGPVGYTIGKESGPWTIDEGLAPPPSFRFSTIAASVPVVAPSTPAAPDGAIPVPAAATPSATGAAIPVPAAAIPGASTDGAIPVSATALVAAPGAAIPIDGMADLDPIDAIVIPGEKAPILSYVGPDSPMEVAHTETLDSENNYRVSVGSRAAPVTIVLPDAPGQNQWIEIRDDGQLAHEHAITIDPGTRNIEGEDSYVMEVKGSVLEIYFNGEYWKIL